MTRISCGGSLLSILHHPSLGTYESCRRNPLSSSLGPTLWFHIGHSTLLLVPSMFRTFVPSFVIVGSDPTTLSRRPRPGSCDRSRRVRHLGTPPPQTQPSSVLPPLYKLQPETNRPVPFTSLLPRFPRSKVFRTSLRVLYVLSWLFSLCRLGLQ